VRVFSAIPLPEPVRDHLAGALAMVDHANPAVSTPSSARWDPAANWHVTLGFYGDRPAQAVDDLIGGLASAARLTDRFELSLAGAGTFRQDVCWIGVADPARALPGLAERLREGYATPNQHAHNRFHVTIARAGRRSGLASAMAALSVYRGPAWTVDQIVLYRSDLGAGPGGHPLYTALAAYGLG